MGQAMSSEPGICAAGRVLMFTELSAHRSLDSTDMQSTCAHDASRDAGYPQLIALPSQATHGTFLQWSSVLSESCYWGENGVKKESKTPRETQQMSEKYGKGLRSTSIYWKQDTGDCIFMLTPLCQPGRTSHFASWQFLLVKARIWPERPPDR